MNLRAILFSLFIAGTLFTACVTKQLGYFEVNPYAKVSTNKIDQPLYVRLNDRIADRFEIKDPGITLKVIDFHKSLYYAFNRSFKDLFLDVQPVVAQSTGFILEVQRMEPRWEVKERKPTNYQSTAPENDVWCVVEYASTIYRNDLLVSQSSGTVKIKRGDDNIYTIDAMFKEAVKQACARMTQDHYNKK
jgi:hypothetical protein